MKKRWSGAEKATTWTGLTALVLAALGLVSSHDFRVWSGIEHDPPTVGAGSPPTSQSAVSRLRESVPSAASPPQSTTEKGVLKKIDPSPRDVAPTINNAPNGIINDHGVMINPTVNNSVPALTLQWSIQSKRFDRESMLHVITIEVTPNIEWHPVSFVIHCDHPIKAVSPFGMFSGTKDWGVADEDDKVAFIYFENPAVAAGTRLSVAVSSDLPFDVVSVGLQQVVPRRNVLDP